MKSSLRLLACFTVSACATTSVSPIPSAAPSPGDARAYHGEFLVQYRPVGIGQHADSSLWLAGNIGHVISADSVRGDWRVAVARADGLTLGSSQFGELSMVWGVLAARDTSFVLASRDGGRSWLKHLIGEGRYSVTAAHVDPAHGSWLGAYTNAPSSSLNRTDHLLHSSDSRTWNRRSSPQMRGPYAAISFSGDSLGIVVSMNNDAFVTHDGGEEWTRIDTPFDQLRYDRRGSQDWIRLHEAHVLSGMLMVNQEGKWFKTRPDSIAWRQIAHLDNSPLYRDASGAGFCSIDSTRRLVLLDDNLAITRRQQRALITPSVAISCHNGRLAAIDMESRVYAEQNGELVQSWPLSSTVSMDTLSRWYRHAGATWGTTGRYLYTKDNADRWYRTAFDASGIDGYRIRNADEVFVWDGRGNQSLFNRRTGLTKRVTSLDGFDVKGMQVHGARWFAWGGKHYESGGRIEGARTFVGGEFFGTRDEGFVVSSSDSGATWKLLDSWPEGGVHAVHISPDANQIVLLSYLGSVRELRRRGNAYDGRTLLVADNSNRSTVPFFEYPFVFYFENDSVGIARGGFHHAQPRAFRTADGGRTWQQVGESTVPYAGTMMLDDRLLAWNTNGFYLLTGARVDSVARLDSIVDTSKIMNGIVRREDHILEFDVHERSFSTPPKRYRVDTRNWRVSLVER